MNDSTRTTDTTACRSCWNGTAGHEGLCDACSAFFAYFTGKVGAADPRAATTHSPVPLWVSSPGFCDYRWQCSCGKRYDDVRNGEVRAQHRAHLAVSA